MFELRIAVTYPRRCDRHSGKKNPTRLGAIFLLTVTLLAERACYSQESSAQAESASASPSTGDERSANENNKSEIPYSITLKLIGGDRKFNLTKAQSDEHQRIVKERSAMSGKLTMFRYYSTPPQVRISQALQSIEDKLDREAADALLASLMSEQESLLRRENREEIVTQLMMIQDRKSRVKSHPGPEVPAHALSGNDLVWAMQYDSLLKRLDLSDEQRDEISRISGDADTELMKIICQCAKDSFVPQAVNLTPTESPAITKLNAEMKRILNPDQQKLYEEFSADRSKRLSEMVAANPAEAGNIIRRMQRFGTLSMLGSDANRHFVTLNNDFLNEETQLAAKVTPEQVDQLSASLKVAEAEMTKEVEQHHEAQVAHYRQAADRARPIIEAHLEKSSGQICESLEDFQLEIIQDQKFRGLGLDALRITELQKILELSAEQIDELTEILNRQPEGLKISFMRPVEFSPDATAEERRKKMDESRKERQADVAANSRITAEYARRQQADAYAVLSPGQRRLFLSLTQSSR